MRSTAALFFFALVMPPLSALGQGSSGVVTKTLKVDLSPSEEKRDYSAESIVVERLDTVYKFAADGTGVREISAVTLIQSDAAARQYGVLTFPFAGNNERVEFDYVRVRKPDGSVAETPAADAQEMPQEVTRQAPFYSDLKEKQLPVRNLRAGDRLEYKARIVVAKAEVPGQFWGQESFAKWAVVLNESVELHVPKGKYVKVWSPEHAPVKSETADETVYRWTGANLEPLIGKDGKTKQREIDPKGELSAMAWTTFRSWDEVGAWYRGLEADRVVPDAEVKAKAAELTAGKTTEEEKARAVYGYVATQIRYIGVAFGIGRYQPHPASEVLRNQYGDCKDKHTLLAAMLTAAGLHPEAALIGAGIRMNEEVPSPGAFNHMITTVPVAGKQVWLDATAEVAPYQVLVSPIRDKQALVVPETGIAKLETTPKDLPFPTFNRFVAKGTLNTEGTMKAQIEYTTRGDDELVLRALFKQVPPGQWDDLTQKISQGLGFGGTTSHAEAGKPDATNEPAKLSYDYEREKTGDWENRRIVAMVPPVFLQGIDEKNPPKKVAIQLGEPRVETASSVIKLPPGWGVELPAAIHEKTAFASFDRTYTVNGDTLTSERKVQIFQREVPASQWKEYKKWFDETVGEGEPYIQLITTDKGSSNTAAGLVREAYMQVKRGELNGAEATLDKAKALNDKQEALWSTYGYLHYERKHWDEAIDAYSKEIALHPETLWVYRSKARAQLNGGHYADAVTTLRSLVKVNPEGTDDMKWLASVLVFVKQPAEATLVLGTLAAKLPEDQSIQLQLASALIASGGIEAGRATLVKTLPNVTDPLLLNNGAYELSKAGGAQELAEKAAQKAVDIMTARTKESKLNAAEEERKQQLAQQSLLFAAWDTLGWICFQQGHLDEAESYLRSAWVNRPDPEVGLHLGQVEEKRGYPAEALEIYEMGLAKVRRLPSGMPNSPDPIQTQLKDRVASLQKNGTVSSIPDPNIALQHTRTLQAGPWNGNNALGEYDIAILHGKVEDVQKSGSGVDVVPGAESMLRGLNLKLWTPQNSDARLVRRGMLNCLRGTCELVLDEM